MKYKLSDICSIITDYVANGSFKALKDNVTYNSKKDYARLIRFVDYSRNFSEEGAVYVSEHSYNFLKKSKLSGGELILANVGTIGESFLCPLLSIPMTLGPNVVMLKTNDNICDQKYLYYYFKSRNGKHLLDSITSSSAVPKFNKTDLRNQEIDLPDLETQKKIVRILFALDQKIELNNQESENLHKIIKTLYRNTASSIKEKTKLADLAKISSGKRPTCIETNGEYAVVGARDVMGFTNEYNQEPEVIITGRVGTLGVVKRYPKKTWASDNTLVVDTKYKNYIECYLSSVDFGAYNRGSTQPLITQTDLKNFILSFNEEECDNFENKTAPLRNKMFAIEEQNEELIKLRDTLLPRLIEGTMDLNKVGL